MAVPACADFPEAMEKLTRMADEVVMVVPVGALEVLVARVDRVRQAVARVDKDFRLDSQARILI